jgi:hypothetical protein
MPLIKGDRIKIENSAIVGSIALTGALIDDVTLKNYNQIIQVIKQK